MISPFSNGFSYGFPFGFLIDLRRPTGFPRSSVQAEPVKAVQLAADAEIYFQREQDPVDVSVDSGGWGSEQEFIVIYGDLL